MSVPAEQAQGRIETFIDNAFHEHPRAAAVLTAGTLGVASIFGLGAAAPGGVEAAGGPVTSTTEQVSSDNILVGAPHWYGCDQENPSSLSGDFILQDPVASVTVKVNGVEATDDSPNGTYWYYTADYETRATSADITIDASDGFHVELEDYDIYENCIPLDEVSTTTTTTTPETTTTTTPETTTTTNPETTTTTTPETTTTTTPETTTTTTGNTTTTQPENTTTTKPTQSSTTQKPKDTSTTKPNTSNVQGTEGGTNESQPSATNPAVAQPAEPVEGNPNYTG